MNHGMWIVRDTINIDSKMNIWRNDRTSGKSKKLWDQRDRRGLRWFAIIWDALIKTMLNIVQQKDPSKSRVKHCQVKIISKGHPKSPRNSIWAISKSINTILEIIRIVTFNAVVEYPSRNIRLYKVYTVVYTVAIQINKFCKIRPSISLVIVFQLNFTAND